MYSIINILLVFLYATNSVLYKMNSFLKQFHEYEKIYILLTEDALLQVHLWEYSFPKGRTSEVQKNPKTQQSKPLCVRVTLMVISLLSTFSFIWTYAGLFFQYAVLQFQIA